MNPEKTRAFIAIDFPPEVVKEIARIQSLIENKPFTGKLTELGNLHLTLKFLGEISKEQLTKVKKILSELSFKKFQAKLQEVGIFSHNKNPRIVWLRVGGLEILELQKQIDKILSPLFPQEKRFMSHLTVARIKYVKDKQAFIDHIKHISVKPLAFKVNNFKLMKSELTAIGPKYTTLETYKLN